MKDTDAFEAPYNLQELKKVYQEPAEAQGKTTAQEQFSKHVLALLGFTNITKRPVVTILMRNVRGVCTSKLEVWHSETHRIRHYPDGCVCYIIHV